jgi:hypothetical protein
MNRGPRFVRISITSAWLISLSGCPLVDPQVGPAQASCAPAGESSGSYSYGGATSSGSSADESCPMDAGNACDDCESLHCCATRSACYGDPVCDCADQALDACLNAAGDDAAAHASDAAADASGAVTRCWDAFSATGQVAQARVSCQRMWCQQACAVP